MVFTELRARENHMLWWVEIMARTRGGSAKVKYGNPFFHWLYNQILMIEDYVYSGTKFQGDHDLPLPADGQLGDIGKKKYSKC